MIKIISNFIRKKDTRKKTFLLYAKMLMDLKYE